MKPDNIEQAPTDEPLAELERHLIDAYLAGAKQTFHDLMMMVDHQAARQLLAEASLYASERLSEIEARSHYLKKLRGAEE